MKSKTFRDNGAIGALLDEYEKAINELKNVIKDISNDTLLTVFDYETSDPDCRSIQTILSHVVKSGHNYVVYIRVWKGEKLKRFRKVLNENIDEYINDLDRMMSYTEQLFIDYPAIKLEEYNNEKKIKVLWGPTFDVEQLMEHAIVHILRHRRQIEKALQKISG